MANIATITDNVISALSGTTSQVLLGNATLTDFKLDSLTDVSVPTPGDGDVLKWNAATSLWEASDSAGITGSGLAGQVAYFTGATTQSGSNNLFWDATNNRLGINTNSPLHPLDVTSAGNTILYIRGGSATSLSRLVFGTSANTDRGFIDYDNTSGARFMSFKLAETEAFRISNSRNFIVNNTSTDNGLRFQVTGDGYFSGSVGIGTSTSAGTELIVRGTTSGYDKNIIIWERATDGAVRGTLGFGKMVGAANENNIYIGSITNHPLLFQTNNIERARIDITGNLGLGVVPSAWSLASLSAMQIQNGGFYGYSVNEVGVTSNSYYNAGWKYINSSFATQYSTFNGVHRWYNAPSGTAGSAITFTQAMTLDASGSLGLGVVPSAWSAYKALEIGGAGSSLWSVGANDIRLATNYVFNSGGKYVADGLAAQYQQTVGQHRWFTAPTGTAGNAITFTQAMTLDASGRLAVGTTSIFTPFTVATTNTRFELSEVSSTLQAIEAINTARSVSVDFGIYSRAFRLYTRPSGTGSYTNHLTLADTGNLLVGTTTDANFKLDVNGTMRVSGASTFSSTISAAGQITGASGATEGKFNFLGYNGAYGGILSNTGLSSSYNAVYLYSNFNAARNGQGNSALPSYILELGGATPNNDSFSIQRSAAGSFTFSNLFKVDGTGAATFSSSVTAASVVSTGNATINGVSVGRGSGASSTNTAVGLQASNSTTTGTYNSSFGHQALFSNTTGTYNVAIGTSSLYGNTTGQFNTAIGLQAGYGTASGTQNITGSNNIFIGKESVGEISSESNRTWIGNASTVSTWVGGNLLIGTRANSTYILDAAGNTRLTGTLLLTGIATLSNLAGASTRIVVADASGNLSTQPTSTYLSSLSGEATNSGSVVTLTNSAVIGKVLTGLNVSSATITASDSILTAFGKIQGQIDALQGGTVYKGSWNANTNTPTITSSTGTQGEYYVVTTAGTTNIDGISSWAVGDWIIFNGTVWEKIPNVDAITSVNGQTGVVSLTTSNINEGTNLYYTDARARAAISLTTSGSSGASTYSSGVLNVPAYTLSGLGGVATGTTITINGVSQDLSTNRTFNVGTVTSVSGTGTVNGLTLSGNVASSGSLTLDGTLSASIDNITDEHRLFNNMGDNHGTRGSFDATTASYNFGWRFVQGSNNGPAVNSATQYYQVYVGLGNDYPATGAGSYGMQIAIPRNVSNPYIAIRYNENNLLYAWQKISAGYADTAGNATTVTSITSGQVTTALGYTPYNSTNPAGYTTNTGTVTSIVAGTYLTGGTITTSGTIAVDATTTNTASKIVARDASGNFSAGTITTLGVVSNNFYDSTGSYNVNIGSGGNEGRGVVAGYSGTAHSGIGYNVRHGSTVTYIAPLEDTSSYLSFSNGGFVFYGAPSGAVGRTLSYTTLGSFSAAGTFNAVNITVNGNQTLHAANWNSYAPSLTGTGASGNWGINITGNANTASSTTFLNNVGNYAWSQSALPTSYQQGLQLGFVGPAAGEGSWQNYGTVLTARTYSGGGGSLQMYVPYSSTFGGDALQVRFGNYSVSGGNSWTSWKTLLQSDNFNSYAPTLTGVGASGIWGISVTGNSATATTWQNARTFTIGSTGKSVDGSGNVSWTLGEIGAQAVLTNPVTGTGNSGYIPIFTGASTIGNSIITAGSTVVDIGFAGTASEYALQIGSGRTTNGYAYIDLVGDATYTDYGLRFIRDNLGANSDSFIKHAGTGTLKLQAENGGSISMLFGATTIMTISSGITISTLAGTGTRMVVADASGNLSAQSIVAPGGSSGQIQFNSSGVFTGSSNFLWDSTENGMRISYASSQGSTYKLQVNGAVYASSYYESSDITQKNVLAVNPRVSLDVDVVKFTRIGDDDVRYGYSAQQIRDVAPELVSSSGSLGVKYIDVHTLKIAALENEIKELKNKLNGLG